MKRAVGTASALLLAAAVLALINTNGNLATGPLKPVSDHRPQVVTPLSSPTDTSSPADDSRDLAGGRAPVPANPGRPFNPPAAAPRQAAPSQAQPPACSRDGQGPQRPACAPQ